MVTVGFVVVFESGSAEAAAPVAGWLETAPSPVQKMEMYSPFRAARLPEPWDPASRAVLAIKIAPWPVPGRLSVKIAGAKAARLTVCGVETWPPTVAVTEACCEPANSHGICRFTWVGEAKIRGRSPLWPAIWKLLPASVEGRGIMRSSDCPEARLVPKTAARLPATTGAT